MYLHEISRQFYGSKTYFQVYNGVKHKAERSVAEDCSALFRNITSLDTMGLLHPTRRVHTSNSASSVHEPLSRDTSSTRGPGRHQSGAHDDHGILCTEMSSSITYPWHVGASRSLRSRFARSPSCDSP